MSLLFQTIYKYFSDEFDKFHSYVIPGYRAKGQDSGRPKAGLAQLSRKDLDVRKDRVVTKKPKKWSYFVGTISNMSRLTDRPTRRKILIVYIAALFNPYPPSRGGGNLTN